MRITDFQKANKIRNEIRALTSTIVSISNIVEVNLVTNLWKLIVVKDLRVPLTENRISEELINVQSSFVAKISNILEEYKQRMEEEFNKV